MVTGDLRVCFVGDSFVAGTGDPEHLGWAGRVAARAHRAGQALTSYNLGVRRQTSRDILERWRVECTPRLPSGCDGRVVLSFGVNDTTIEEGRQRVAGADSARHLCLLLREARSSGWPVLVVGPPPVADAEHNARTVVLSEWLQQVCRDEGAPYVPTLPALSSTPVWMQQVAAGDGAHPGAEGYAALAELVWPAWDAWCRPRLE